MFSMEMTSARVYRGLILCIAVAMLGAIQIRSAVPGGTTPAFAQSSAMVQIPPTSGTGDGCQTNTLPANDDGSTGLIPLPFTLNFDGTTFNSLYVNNNGNITFDVPLSTFTPFGLIGTSSQIIAPFFADVDTRGAGSVTYGTGLYNGHQAFCVDWTNVGYYNTATDKLNDFQLLLVQSDPTTNDFNIIFNYNQVQWEIGDASGGFDGLGSSSQPCAHAGYSNGTTVAGASFELTGSGTCGAFLDSNTSTGLIHNSANAGGVLGRYIYSIVNGACTNCGTGAIATPQPTIPTGCTPSTRTSISTTCYVAVTPPVSFTPVNTPVTVTFTCDALVASLHGTPGGCASLSASAHDQTQASGAAPLGGGRCAGASVTPSNGTISCSTSKPICPVGLVPTYTSCGTSIRLPTGSVNQNTMTVTFTPSAAHVYTLTFTGYLAPLTATTCPPETGSPVPYQLGLACAFTLVATVYGVQVTAVDLQTPNGGTSCSGQTAIVQGILAGPPCTLIAQGLGMVELADGVACAGLNQTPVPAPFPPGSQYSCSGTGSSGILSATNVHTGLPANSAITYSVTGPGSLAQHPNLNLPNGLCAGVAGQTSTTTTAAQITICPTGDGDGTVSACLGSATSCTPSATFSYTPGTTIIRSVTVPGGAGWVNSGLTVTAGDSLLITSVGTWSTGLVGGSRLGPDGSVALSPDNFFNLTDLGTYPAHTATGHWGALIGYIGSNPPQPGEYVRSSTLSRAQQVFLVGSHASTTTSASGTLWLAMNDDAYSGYTRDNSGQVTSTVTLTGASD